MVTQLVNVQPSTTRHRQAVEGQWVRRSAPGLKGTLDLWDFSLASLAGRPLYPRGIPWINASSSGQFLDERVSLLM